MKNIKLLLATTAILSMGAMAANADNVNISGTSKPLQVSVRFVEPVTIVQQQALSFGTILNPTGGEYVKLTPEGNTSDSTAQLAFATDYNKGPSVGRLGYTGVARSSNEFFIGFSSTADGTQFISTGDINLINGSGQNAKTCGTAHFERSYVSIPSTLEDGDSIVIGGKFTVDANYDHTIGYGECTGTVYVTLMLME